MNNIFNKFFGQKQKVLDLSQIQSDLIGWHDTNRINTYDYYLGNQYENGYASIQAIKNQFMMIKPYAVDAKGKLVANANIINVLARPNRDMDSLTFREALSIMSLVHNKVYIRVWHIGNKITERNITGFTFLEGVHEYEDGDKTIYQTPQGETLDDSEVVVLKNINPYDLSKGYSIANAARRWADIDDYIAAFQTGFFKNGAVPAGQFLIQAQGTEFDDIVRNLKQKHRGADKTNNVIYSSTPYDTVSGKTLPAQITWVPMNTANKDLALKDIFDQVNQKIDSAYGVPASMRGVNDNNTYASVRIDQEMFTDNTIRPFATKIWTQFTHELNNITGGLGYFITFDLDTPHIAEEDKAKAETEQITVNTLTVLLDAGYTLESAVTALELPDEYLELVKAETPQTSPETPTVDVPEVDEGGEVEDAPEEQPVKSLDPLAVNCKHCNRYLFKATGTTVIEEMPCPKCKATNNFKIINPLGDDLTHEFRFVETEPKDWKQVANSKKLTPEQTAVIQQKVATAIRSQMQHQIDRTDVKSKALGDDSEADIILYAKELMTIVEPVVQSEGAKQYLLARTIQGIQTQNLDDFKLNQTQIDKYTDYLQDIVKSYSDDTAASIRQSLETDISNNIPINEVKTNLSKIMQTDEYRVQRLALTETNRAGSAGSIYGMEKVQKDTGLKIAKIWQARSGACQYCVSLNGTEVGISEPFVKKGEDIEGADGGVYKNTFGHMDESVAHPNCGCYTTYKVVKD